MKRQVAVKSTRGFALKSTHGIAIKSTNMASAEKGESAPVRKNTRQFYDGEESCYIIDAKLEGNLGRYLNVRPLSRTSRCRVIPGSSNSSAFNATVETHLFLLQILDLKGS